MQAGKKKNKRQETNRKPVIIQTFRPEIREDSGNATH